MSGILKNNGTLCGLKLFMDVFWSSSPLGKYIGTVLNGLFLKERERFELRFCWDNHLRSPGEQIAFCSYECTEMFLC